MESSWPRWCRSPINENTIRWLLSIDRLTNIDQPNYVDHHWPIVSTINRPNDHLTTTEHWLSDQYWPTKLCQPKLSNHVNHQSTKQSFDDHWASTIWPTSKSMQSYHCENVFSRSDNNCWCIEGDDLVHLLFCIKIGLWSYEWLGSLKLGWVWKLNQWLDHVLDQQSRMM